MSFESGLAFFIAILIFSVTPGPGCFALLAKALSKGVGECWPLAFGMVISDIIYLVLACLGLSVIAENYSTVFSVIRILGAAYLIYLGWKMWRDRSHLVAEAKPNTKGGIFANFFQGLMISATNPKVILFYIAFLPTFMDLSALDSRSIVIASVLCLVGLMIGLMAVSYSAAWARTYFQSAKAMTGLNRVAGSIMIFAGVYLGSK